MDSSVSEAIASTYRAMEKEGYTKEQIIKYSKLWSRLEKYALDNNVSGFTAQLCNDYLESEGLLKANLTKAQSVKVSRINLLLRFVERGTFSPTRKKQPPAVPEQFQTLMSLVEKSKSFQRSSEERNRNRRRYLGMFFEFIKDEIDQPKDIDADCFTRFIVSLGSLKIPSINLARGSLRPLVGILISEYGADPRLEKMQCLKSVPYRVALPSYYKPEEIAKVVEAAASGDYPKRNFLIVLLLAQYGIRCGDVEMLKISDFDWTNNRITLTQSKTGGVRSLPIVEEVKFAYIDYVKNERPETDSPYLFVRMVAPGKGKGPVTTLKGVVRSAFERSGVDTKGRKHGSHVFRHSLATTMMNEGIAYTHISHILGHDSRNATRTYLKMDIEKLRLMGNEVIIYEP